MHVIIEPVNVYYWLIKHIMFIPIAAFFVIVNYMDNSTLYCTSENLFQSLQEATAFCVITGETTATNQTGGAF